MVEQANIRENKRSWRRSKQTRKKERKLRHTQLVKNLKENHKEKEKGFTVVFEELKKRITANSMKIKRYKNRLSQLTQNRLFASNKQILLVTV